MEGRKSSIRKSVQQAYDRALFHQRRVRGETMEDYMTSDDSSEETQDTMWWWWGLKGRRRKGWMFLTVPYCLFYLHKIPNYAQNIRHLLKYVSSSIKMMHMSDPTLYLFIYFYLCPLSSNNFKYWISMHGSLVNWYVILLTSVKLKWLTTCQHSLGYANLTK